MQVQDLDNHIVTMRMTSWGRQSRSVKRLCIRGDAVLTHQPWGLLAERACMRQDVFKA